MNMVEYYRRLHQLSGDVLGGLFSDDEALETLTASHNYISDYERIKDSISSRPEVEVINAAMKEYQFALFALSVGQYRHAFVGLRLFFELMLAAVQFSAHEIDYRLWAKDAKDINWNSLKDTQTGIFSATFINAFNPNDGFSEHAKQYSTLAERVYRECSEFVHGNAKTHLSLPNEILFDRELFFSWHQKAETMRIVIVFVFCARYLSCISTSSRGDIEPIVIETIGHLPAVQSIFSTYS